MMNQSGHLFSADPEVTQLFFGQMPSCGPRAPEKDLMLAVLADAVECFCKYSTVRGLRARLFREAEEWIFAEDEELPFSFNNICAALSLNPDYIRHGMLEWCVPQAWGYKAGQRDFSLKNVKRIKKLSRGGRLASGRG